MTKAIYNGTCQICGRTHKVRSNGLLAKHGYQVSDFGFFAGTCFGSDHQPLEISCNVIADAIRMYQATAESMMQDMILLSNQPTEPKAFVSCSSWVSRSRQVHTWKQCTLIYTDGNQITQQYADGRTDKYGPRVAQPTEQALLDHAFDLNKRRVVDLKKERAAVKHMVAALEDRIANWAPKALMPITELVC